MFEIRFKDIDPDTGHISQDVLLAVSDVSKYADLIVDALAQEDDEPNREFYTRDLSDPNRELTYKERVAWFVANYYETGMEYEGMLVALRNVDLDNFQWRDGETICFPRTFMELRDTSRVQ